jgi:glutamate N-acetyltransferase/amino-acid N-acetyltransferase
VLANSGQANACTGGLGLEDCRRSLALAGEALGLGGEDLLPASTGVIGPRIRMDRLEAALPALKRSLGAAEPEDFARAIMTTDTFPKTASRAVDAGGEFLVLGIAKGAGMISPDMATMLAFIFTDAGVGAKDLADVLRGAVNLSFNRVTVDGDTSTNDCVLMLANGASGAEPVGAGRQEAFAGAVLEVCRDLAYMIVQDAEGGTKVARIAVSGAKDEREAELAARAVGDSPLVKTALFGKDPNWGRIAAALGRSGVSFEPGEVAISIAGVKVFEAGLPAVEDVDAALAGRLEDRDVDIEIVLGGGPGKYLLLASDLTREYVSINADYRS